MLANGERVDYKTEISFDDFKRMISEKEFIEIEREPWVSIPNGWSSRPPRASYLTKSIIYVNWDEDREEIIKERNRKLERQRDIKTEILSYKPNFRIKWKFKWDYETLWDKDEVYNRSYIEGFLESVLEHCKKYKCKRLR